MDNYTKDYELRVAVLEMRAQQAQLEAQIARVELQQMQIREPLSSEVSVAVQAQPETLTHARSGKHSGKQRGRPPGANKKKQSVPCHRLHARLLRLHRSGGGLRIVRRQRQVGRDN